MGRVPSGNDEKMLKAGVALAKARGLNGYSVREVCARSKVNLGMFHYYFGRKDNFDRAVLKKIYSVMMERINITISPSGAPRDNVRGVLVKILEFVKENRVLLSSLGGDVLSGNRKTLKFIADNFTKHVEILYGELKRAQDRGELKGASASDAILFLMPSIVLPQILLGLLCRLKVNLSFKIKAAGLGLVVDRGALRRIDMMIDAIFGEEK